MLFVNGELGVANHPREKTCAISLFTSAGIPIHLDAFATDEILTTTRSAVEINHSGSGLSNLLIIIQSICFLDSPRPRSSTDRTEVS